MNFLEVLGMFCVCCCPLLRSVLAGNCDRCVRSKSKSLSLCGETRDQEWKRERKREGGWEFGNLGQHEAQFTQDVYISRFAKKGTQILWCCLQCCVHEHSNWQQCVPYFAYTCCEHLRVLCELGLRIPDFGGKKTTSQSPRIKGGWGAQGCCPPILCAWFTEWKNHLVL